MPSSIHFTPSVVSNSSNVSIYTRPQKKQKMSITQTYFLAHSARGKLSREASRSDHDLRDDHLRSEHDQRQLDDD